MRFFQNDAVHPDLYYEPNSFGGPSKDPSFRELPLRISGDADRYNHRVGNDSYSQRRAMFNLFDDEQKQLLFSNIAGAMQGVPENIVSRQIVHFEKIDPAFAMGVTEAMAQQ